MKTCSVVFATPERQWQWQVTLADTASVAEVLAAARAQQDGIDTRRDIPWDSAEVGIFGVLCDRATVSRDGDRIEIYRPLRADPKESRRARAQAVKAAPDRAARPGRRP